MIESPLGLFQREMEILFGNASVMIEPVFGIGPEAFDTVDVISTFGAPLVFTNDHVIASDIQKSIGVPVVGVIQATRLGVGGHERTYLLDAPVADGEG